MYLKKSLELNERMLEKFYLNGNNKDAKIKIPNLFIKERLRHTKTSLAKEIEMQKQNIEFLINWKNGNKSSYKLLKSVLIDEKYDGKILPPTSKDDRDEHLITSYALIYNALHDFYNANKTQITEKELQLYIKQFASIIRTIDCRVASSKKDIESTLKMLCSQKTIELKDGVIKMVDFTRISRIGYYSIQTKDNHNNAKRIISIFNEEKRLASKMVVNGIIRSHNPPRENKPTKR